jgi:ATP-dependent helicase/nuclease subunit A
VIGVLRTNISLAAVYTPPQLLRRILDQSPYLSVLAQKASGNQETANISKLVRMTIDFQSKGYKTLYDYVNFLKESIEETEDEAQAAIADESDSVKVMTLHQAKGLEYPAVFLYNAHEITFSEKVKKGSIQIDKDFGLLAKVPLNNDYFGDYHSAPLNNLFDYITTKKETAELKRLFYVGATRAKNYLFISAPDMEKYKPGSFMALLQEGLNIDFTSDSYIIKDELRFLKIKNNEFIEYSEKLEERINIVRNLDTPALPPLEYPKEDQIKKVLISKISDFPKGEIISATKFASFRQCPLKYSLTYEFGVSGLVRNYRKYLLGKLNNDRTKYDFSPKEDSDEEPNEEKISLPAELKGSIIHKILQKNNPHISHEEILDIIKDKTQIADAETARLLQLVIFGKLKILFDSESYKRFYSYKNSYTEYEIYLNERDYFLHGIIDRLIIDDKKAIIIDYKTDDVQKEEIYNRASLYFPQLKFYSYIVSRLYKELTSFELRLIFINFPEEDVNELISREEVIRFGDEIRAMISQIRLREFDRNLSHCKECSFALKDSKCIVERA